MKESNTTINEEYAPLPEGHAPEGHTPEGHTPEEHAPEEHTPEEYIPPSRIRIVSYDGETNIIIQRIVNSMMAVVMLFLIVGIDYRNINNIIDAVTNNAILVITLLFGFTFYSLITMAGSILIINPTLNCTWGWYRRCRYFLIFNICLLLLNNLFGFVIVKTYANNIHPKIITWYTNCIGCGVIGFCICAIAILITIIGSPIYLLYKCYIRYQ